MQAHNYLLAIRELHYEEYSEVQENHRKQYAEAIRNGKAVIGIMHYSIGSVVGNVNGMIFDPEKLHHRVAQGVMESFFRLPVEYFVIPLVAPEGMIQSNDSLVDRMEEDYGVRPHENLGLSISLFSTKNDDQVRDILSDLRDNPQKYMPVEALGE